jgi:hypothetical protein
MAGVPSNGFEGLLGDLLKAMGGAPATAWFDAARGLAVSVVTDEQEGPGPVAAARAAARAEPWETSRRKGS